MKNKIEAVEILGVQMEKFGRSPMESRVFAYLLVAEPPHASFDEIKEFLKALSKSMQEVAVNIKAPD